MNIQLITISNISNIIIIIIIIINLQCFDTVVQESELYKTRRKIIFIKQLTITLAVCNFVVCALILHTFSVNGSLHTV